MGAGRLLLLYKIPDAADSPTATPKALFEMEWAGVGIWKDSAALC
jgi:hypothetical protein